MASTIRVIGRPSNLGRQRQSLKDGEPGLIEGPSPCAQRMRCLRCLAQRGSPTDRGASAWKSDELAHSGKPDDR